MTTNAPRRKIGLDTPSLAEWLDTSALCGSSFMGSSTWARSHRR
jgi:hypothetical protein